MPWRGEVFRSFGCTGHPGRGRQTPAPPFATPVLPSRLVVGSSPLLKSSSLTLPTRFADVRFCLSGWLARLRAALVQEQLLVPGRGERSGRVDRGGAPPGAALDRHHRSRRRVRHRAGPCEGRRTRHPPDRRLADHPAGQLGNHASGDESRRLCQPLPAGHQGAPAQPQRGMQRHLARGCRTRRRADRVMGRGPKSADPVDRREGPLHRRTDRSLFGRLAFRARDALR